MSAMENAYALVVGIAGYQHINRLPLTIVRDAQNIYDLLVDPHHCAYRPENVQLLLDSQATLESIRCGLAELAAQTDHDSIAFFYISSHGGHVESGPYAGEYILPVDADCTSNQSLSKTSISGADFTETLQAIPARKAIVIFDCCHAGGIGQPKDAVAPRIKNGLPESYYDLLKAGRGRVIMASSRSTEFSYVMPNAQNSLFTQHLLAGLRGGVPSEDGLIRIFDLFEYLQPRVTGDQPDQHPIFKADIEENFPIALYLGGQKGVISRDSEGFRYDVYVSYAHKEPDAEWVWETLVPRLKEVGVSVAVSGAVETPGVARVVGIERAIKQSKHTVVVLSKAYVTDNWGHFQNVLAQTLGVEDRQARVLPVIIEQVDKKQIRSGLGMLYALDLADPHLSEHNFDRLVETLQGPIALG